MANFLTSASFSLIFPHFPYFDDSQPISVLATAEKAYWTGETGEKTLTLS